MATLIVSSQDELDKITNKTEGWNIIDPSDIDVILVKKGKDTKILKGPFQNEESID